jgi:hypothetical protein
MSKVLLDFDETGNPVWVTKGPTAERKIPRNDSCFTLGCIKGQVNKFREDAKKHGYAVEFKEDKEVPGFYNADLTSMSARQRDKYADHRAPREEEGVKTGSKSGVGVTTPGELKAMEEWAKARWG